MRFPSIFSLGQLMPAVLLAFLFWCRWDHPATFGLVDVILAFMAYLAGVGMGFCLGADVYADPFPVVVLVTEEQTDTRRIRISGDSDVSRN